MCVFWLYKGLRKQSFHRIVGETETDPLSRTSCGSRIVALGGRNYTWILLFNTTTTNHPKHVIHAFNPCIHDGYLTRRFYVVLRTPETPNIIILLLYNYSLDKHTSYTKFAANRILVWQKSNETDLLVEDKNLLSLSDFVQLKNFLFIS